MTTTTTNTANETTTTATTVDPKAQHTQAIRDAFNVAATTTLRASITKDGEVKAAAQAGKAHGKKLARDVMKAKIKVLCKDERAMVDEEAQALIEAFIAESSESVQ